MKRRAPDRRHKLTRGSFYTHLWVGIVITIALTVICVTGILLNHKRGLGLMPEVDRDSSAPFTSALPLAELARLAMAAVPSAEGDDPAVRVDRMDVRPRDGLIKVRLRDAASTEVTLDLSSGRVLHVGRRGDVFLEKLHSGEIFGRRWVLLSDAAAVGLLITLITGYWLWLFPKIRHTDPAAGAEPGGGESAS
ncbi:MAG: PepSY-associated TM helix domain-containing protein [Gemmatimonadaceae bacterium]